MYCERRLALLSLILPLFADGFFSLESIFKQKNRTSLSTASSSPTRGPLATASTSRSSDITTPFQVGRAEVGRRKRRLIFGDRLREGRRRFSYYYFSQPPLHFFFPSSSVKIPHPTPTQNALPSQGRHQARRTQARPHPPLAVAGSAAVEARGLAASPGRRRPGAAPLGAQVYGGEERGEAASEDGRVVRCRWDRAAERCCCCCSGERLRERG